MEAFRQHRGDPESHHRGPGSRGRRLGHHRLGGGILRLNGSGSDPGARLPGPFLGSDAAADALSEARAAVLPVPYEATTSYGGGTENGPGAILEASAYVELWDQELGSDPSIQGIHTLPALTPDREDPAAAMADLESSYARILETLDGRFLVMLGGEHAISAPAVRAHAARIRTSGSGDRIHVLQLDAHADLRESYQGSPHSHASAMARVLDVADVVGVGIRGISEEEIEVSRRRNSVTLIYADEMWEDDGWMDRALDALGDPVYVTFDVDFLDPSVMPSTGTPEPGGGDWYRTLRFLRRVFRERTVLACDVVELAPVPGLHAPDFVTAKLVYKLLGYGLESSA